MKTLFFDLLFFLPRRSWDENFYQNAKKSSPNCSNILSEKFEGFEFIMCIFTCRIYKFGATYSF